MFINFMKTRSSKVLKYVKTDQISILSLTHHVLAKYKPLVLKICVGYPLIEQACENFDMLTNIETMLTLMCITPLVESIYSLITFAQSQFGFICDYVAIVKVFLVKKITFSTPIQVNSSSCNHHKQYVILLDCAYHTILMGWFIIPTT